MAYEGFSKLSSELAANPKVRNPKALAASIGRKKYGSKPFQSAAASGTKMRGMSKGR